MRWFFFFPFWGKFAPVIIFVVANCTPGGGWGGGGICRFDDLSILEDVAPAMGRCVVEEGTAAAASVVCLE